MPSVPLPADYLDFLRWSDGPWVRKGEREFGFFTAREIRGYLLGYHFPECLPGAIPLGLDGGFIFAFFDTRGGPASEYPILAAHFSAMDFDGAVPVANTFLEFCSGTERIIDVLSPPDPKADAWHKKVDVILEKNPESLPALVSLRNHFELKMPASQLLALARTAPQVLLGGISNGRCEMLMNALPPALAPLIRIRESTQAPANP